MEKLADTLKKAANNNYITDVLLAGSFAALSIRSLNQEKLIDELEAENVVLQKSNKAMKTTMWDWKQKLYAESSSQTSVIPLPRIKAIYGDVSSSNGEAVKGKQESSPQKLVI